MAIEPKHPEGIQYTLDSNLCFSQRQLSRSLTDEYTAHYEHPEYTED